MTKRLQSYILLNFIIVLPKLIGKDFILIVVYILSKILNYISTLEEYRKIESKVIRFLILREVNRLYKLSNIVVLDQGP